MDKLDYQEISDLALSTGVTVTLTGVQVAILLSLVNTGTHRYLWRVAGVKPTNDQWLDIMADLSTIENILLG